MSDILSIHGLCKRFAAFSLEDVSFSLGYGRIMGLIGINGAGKTTTLKCMLNFMRPSTGEISLLGRPFPAEEAACKREIGVVFGGVDFYRLKRLRDITAVTRRFYDNWDDSAYLTYMRMFDLDANKRVCDLSSGMRVKYAIALALSHRSRLLVFDEPTSGLDPVSRNDLLELFAQLVKSGERSILFSTHITADLEKCADDITYIQAGKVLSSAEKGAFLQAYAHLAPDGRATPTLEEIMIHTERRQYAI